MRFSRWLLPAVALVTGCGAGEPPTAQPTTSVCTSTTPAPSTTAPSTTTTTTWITSTTLATTTTAAPRAALTVGATGDRVRILEEQLQRLGYWPGTVDEQFDDDTRHAVVALQKAAGLSRDGIAGDATKQALYEAVQPVPRGTDGIEIDLGRQLLLVVRDGRLDTVFDTSTGGAGTPTPRGRWQVTRQIDGLRRSALGLLYRPKYFTGGYAIHGYTSVPPRPASHGCVRVTYHAMDHVWAADLAPLGTPVWVY